MAAAFCTPVPAGYGLVVKQQVGLQAARGAGRQVATSFR